jgi:phage gp36-like protein
MYCTLEDIKKAIPEKNIIELTDDDNFGSIDEAKVQDAIDYAEQLIDGYLRGRYPVPLEPVPELIRRLAVDLAVFHLYSRRFELDMPQSMIDRRKEIIRLLEQIQAGKVLLGIETQNSPGQGYYKANKTTEDRTFSKDILNKF